MALGRGGRRGDVRSYLDVGDWGGDGHVVFVLRGLKYRKWLLRRRTSTWDTSGVMSMDGMFIEALSFNRTSARGTPPASYRCTGCSAAPWRLIKTSVIDSVTTMFWMFYGASAFDQDLGWCVDDDVDLYAFNGTPASRRRMASYKLQNATIEASSAQSDVQWRCPIQLPGLHMRWIPWSDAKMNAIDWSSDSAIQAACADPEVYDGNTRAGVLYGWGKRRT